MPLPCPGPAPISLLDIQNEFGGSYLDGTYTQIKEYYRGGAYVASNNPANANIPTSGQISFNQFFCSSGEIIVYITQDTANVDVSALFGTFWTSLIPKRLIINPGVRVYNTNPYKISNLNGYAMRIYDTFNGKLTIENRGSIQGAAGRRGGDTIIAGESRTNKSNGGQGGNAIYIGPIGALLNFNRYYNGSNHYYGQTPLAAGYNLQASNYFNVFESQITGTTALYQLSNPINGANLLTASSIEYSNLTSTGTSTVNAFPGLTTITGLNYIPGYITVQLTYFFSSGFVTIPPSDYTATDGKTIVLKNPITQQQGNLGTIYINSSKAWTKGGIVGYVHSSTGSNRVPIYRLKNSSVPTTNYLFSTSSTEAGYTSEGIAFYAPTPTQSSVVVFIDNKGTIYAGGGGGGQGGSNTSGSSSPITYYYTPFGDCCPLQVIVQGLGGTGGLGGWGQGYNQSNTSPSSGLGAFGVKADITMSSLGGNRFKFPKNSNVTITAYSSGQSTHYFSSNSTIEYVMYSSGTNGGLSFAGSNNSISLKRYSSGFNGTLTKDPAQTYSDLALSSGFEGTVNNVPGGGPEQTDGQITIGANGVSAIIPVPTAGSGGMGGEGATWGNTGQTGKDGGLPGGNGGYAIVNASKYVSYVTQGTIAGQTT